MASFQRKPSREEGLNDSWVELQFQSQTDDKVSLDGKQTPISMTTPPLSASAQQPIFMQSGQMEKLLLEAQRDSSRSTSRQGSVISNRSSPRSPHSPNELNMEGLATLQDSDGDGQEGQVFQKCSDWIWDWSSRPEAIPPSEYSLRCKHPRRNKYSVRNTEVMRSGIFNLENLPTLLLTHACTFIMGAAVMFLYLKKYCKWSVIAIQPME